jgi:prephenate dehydrogenase
MCTYVVPRHYARICNVTDLGAVLIIGSGMMGTSIGLALRRTGIEVYLTDTDPNRLHEAIDRGAGKHLTRDVVPHVVVACVPPRQTPGVLSEAAQQYPDAVLTDIASVKAPVLEETRALGVASDRLVGGHPMAGREMTGPAAARADLFEDRWWVITPGADPSAVARVEALAKACGAVPITMSEVDHDRAVALVSHVPQVLSSVLAAQLLDASADHVRIAGQGLRDMTRIAGSDAALWSDILSANADQVAAVLTKLTNHLHGIERILTESPEPQAELETIITAGGSGQQRIPGKHGAQAVPVAIVPVMVADEPGQLAALVVAAGDAGINLEDIRIEHVLGRPSGLIELFVRPDDGPVLQQVLRSAGFDVRA